MSGVIHGCDQNRLVLEEVQPEDVIDVQALDEIVVIAVTLHHLHIGEKLLSAFNRMQI